MFDNIGKKIKALAVVGCWLGIIISAILAVSFLSSFAHITQINQFDRRAVIAFLIFFAGVIVSWVASFGLYGFGELIDKTTTNEIRLQTITLKIDELISIFESKNEEKIEEYENEMTADM